MTTQQKLNQKLLLNIKSEPNVTPPSQSSDRMERQSPQSHQYPTTLEALSNYQLNLNPHHTALNLHHLMSKENNNNQQTPNIASTSGIPLSAPSGRQPVRRRARRRATSASQDPAEHLTEMSVRGLNLFRYASVSEGIYQCTECAKVDVQKTFKNKYSFQRHAFLYHEGHQRKVFPCPICSKEFSRPDKMKNHMKTVHDCFMPKECVFPPQSNFYSNPITSSPGQVVNSNPATVLNSNPSLM